VIDVLLILTPVNAIRVEILAIGLPPCALLTPYFCHRAQAGPCVINVRAGSWVAVHATFVQVLAIVVDIALIGVAICAVLRQIFSYRFGCLACRSECPAAAESDPGSGHAHHRQANRQKATANTPRRTMSSAFIASLLFSWFLDSPPHLQNPNTARSAAKFHP